MMRPTPSLLVVFLMLLMDSACSSAAEVVGKFEPGRMSIARKGDCAGAIVLQINGLEKNEMCDGGLVICYRSFLMQKLDGKDGNNGDATTKVARRFQLSSDNNGNNNTRQLCQNISMDGNATAEGNATTTTTTTSAAPSSLPSPLSYNWIVLSSSSSSAAANTSAADDDGNVVQVALSIAGSNEGKFVRTINAIVDGNLIKLQIAKSDDIKEEMAKGAMFDETVKMSQLLFLDILPLLETEYTDIHWAQIQQTTDAGENKKCNWTLGELPIIERAVDLPTDETDAGNATELTTTEMSTESTSTTTTPMPKISVPQSYQVKKGIENRVEIRIRGHVEPNATHVQINLLHNAPEWHANFGATVLQINVDFTAKQIAVRSYMEKKWFAESSKVYKELKAAMFECNVTLWRVGGQSMTQQPKNDFGGDAAFDFSHTKAEIRWNFDNHGETVIMPEFEVAKMPIWMFNSLQIDGDVQLLMAPEIHIKPATDSKKYKLPRHLYYGDRLCFVVRPTANFSIFLLHDANELNKQYGIVPLIVNFYESNYKTYLQMRRFIQNDFPSFAEEEVNFPPGKQSVSVDILVKGNEYEIVNPDDEQLSKEDLKHADMPPYAVNWVQIKAYDGGSVDGLDMIPCPKTDWSLPRWIKQIPAEQPIVPGTAVRIQGNIQPKRNGTEMEDNTITISFFHGTFEWETIIGKTIFRAAFTINNIGSEYASILQMNSFIDGKWIHKKAPYVNIDPPLVFEQKFDVRIVITNQAFIVCHDAKNYTYNIQPEEIPLWAIQYIVVKGRTEKKNVGTILELTEDIQVGPDV